MFTGMNFYNKRSGYEKTTKFIAIIVLLCGLWGLHENNFIDTEFVMVGSTVRY